MGLVIQFQRRAIETLRPHVREAPIPSDLALGAAQFTRNDGFPLFALGVSNGYGTCAGIHGMDVLVLGADRPESTPWLPLSQPASQCAYAVLLRDLTTGEYMEWCRANLRHDPTISLKVVAQLPTSRAIERYINRAICCVELLQVAQVRRKTLVLSVIGYKAFYVSLC
jgi:hypothetical protein